MDWIAKLGQKPKKTLIQQVENLNLNEQNPPKTYTTFNRQSLKSRHLPQAFKNYNFTDLTQFCQDSHGLPLIQFMITMPTQYSNIQICLTITIDLQKQHIKYNSYPIKQAQMLNFTNQQVISLARLFSFHLNSKLSLGWLTIDPQSGCLTYKHANNSLGFLQKRIEKVPEDLTQFLCLEVQQIQRNWKSTLPDIFSLLNINQNKNLSHPYWNSNSRKAKNHYDSPEFISLTQYIKHSFIQYPDMFDDSLTSPARKIRSKNLSENERKKKYLNYRSNQDFLNYCSQPLHKNINNVLSLYCSEKNVEQQLKMIKKDLDQKKIAQLSSHLCVNKYQSKNQIFSQLRITQTLQQSQLSRSAFSQLKVLLIQGRRTEDAVQTSQRIVAKQTDHHRFTNQMTILRLIGRGRSYFITRYFECTQRPKQILLEYCHLKSINSYITANRQIMSFQTKILLLSRIALGIRFLRDYGIHHNDLKPQNVLLKIIGNNTNTFLITRLIDFGESYCKDQRDLMRRNHYHRGWTIPYAPPQQVRSSKYSQKTDIFSLGILLYQFVFGPFPVQTFRKGRQLYVKDESYLCLCAMAPQKCRDFSCPKLMQAVYTLFLRCINPDPEYRPSIDWIFIILKEIVFLSENIAFF